jgi:hypothetical protein
MMRKAMVRNNLEGYVEKHHVFPQSLYKNSKLIVKLTAKEHFIAHYLLWKACKSRYGILHHKTKKMHFAFNQMTWCSINHKRYVSRSFDIARRCSTVYNAGENNPAKREDVKLKIRAAKMGVNRADMRGKRYFGATEDTIKNGIEKMRLKKLGKKIDNYPKNRKGAPCSKEKAQKIKESRLKTSEKYAIMSREEFISWLKDKSAFRKDGRKNPNITVALKVRNETWEDYYET